MMKTILGLLVLSLCLPVADSRSVVHGQAPPSASRILSRRVTGLRLVNVTAAEALVQVLDESDTPGGTVEFDGGGQEKRFTLHLSKGTIGSSLQAIVAADPRYRWVVDGRAVNLLPRVIPPFLNVNIPAFDSGRASNVSLAISMLVTLPTVRAAARRMGIDRGVNTVDAGTLMSVPLPGAPPPKPLGVRCKGVTLRHALNMIVVANKTGIWVYRESHSKGSGGFRISLHEIN